VNRVVPKGLAPLGVVGTTASGKSALAMALARRHPEVELVSIDSMQVYRGMDIGTAKPTAAEQADVRHHLIDVVDPSDPFDVHTFQRLVADSLADIAGRGRKAILVGGTGLYLQAVIDGFEIPGQFPDVASELETEPETEALHRRLVALDPVAAARMEPTNRRRVLRALEVCIGSGRPFSSFGPGVDAYSSTPVRLVGIRHPPEVVIERITSRYAQQLADGFLDEVRRLATGPPLGRTAAHALGYRELLAHLHATEPDPGASADSVDDPAWAASLVTSVDEAIRRTRHFARRQRSWFRRDPRITWLDATDSIADRVDLVNRADHLATDHWS
jgi:tRNA dimethylallyltransferase